MQNITGTGVDKIFFGIWKGTVTIEDPSYVPLASAKEGETSEENPTEREIIVNINDDGSITIDNDNIPAANIYKDMENNVYSYTISYLLIEDNKTKLFNYMLIFSSNEKATIEGTTTITSNQKQEKTNIPITTLNKEIQNN